MTYLNISFIILWIFFKNLQTVEIQNFYYTYIHAYIRYLKMNQSNRRNLLE